jgi:hypothetical protein
MNRAQAAAMLPFITAFAKGEDVQLKTGYGENVTWRSCEDLMFEGNPGAYRIKPKAEEFFTVYDKDGKRLAICTTWADADVVRFKNPGSCIKVYAELGGK